MLRITRADVGVFDDPRDDGQEQTRSLCSPLHGNQLQHLHHRHYHWILLLNWKQSSQGGACEPSLSAGARLRECLRDRGICCWKNHTWHWGHYHHRPGDLVVVHPDAVWLTLETQIIESSSSSLLLSVFNIFILIAGWSTSDEINGDHLNQVPATGLIKIFLHGEPQISKREAWSRSVVGLCHKTFELTGLTQPGTGGLASRRIERWLRVRGQRQESTWRLVFPLVRSWCDAYCIVSTLEGGSRESWPPSASIHPRLLGKSALAAAGNVGLLFEHFKSFLVQVFGLDKVGVISLLRKLTGAKHSIDREALWEAAETYHRLHQVLSSLIILGVPPLISWPRWSCVHLVAEEPCMDLPLL